MIDRRTLLIGLSSSVLLASKLPSPAERYTLTGAKGRIVDVWRWPARGRRRGRIHFSHGNFSAPQKYDRLLAYWAGQGWDVHAPLHVDSSDHPEKARYSQTDSWAMRVEDLALLGADLGTQSYIAAGHSYGALMALVLGGATPLLGGTTRDPRVMAVVALSPPGPMPGFIDTASYASLAVPALIQTGDKDIFPGQAAESWRNHLAAFEAAAPGGGRHALVFEGVDHYFGGVIGRPELPGPKAEMPFAYFLKASTQFIGRVSKSAAQAKALTFPASKGVTSIKR